MAGSGFNPTSLPPAHIGSWADHLNNLAAKPSGSSATTGVSKLNQSPMDGGKQEPVREPPVDANQRVGIVNQNAMYSKDQAIFDAEAMSQAVKSPPPPDAFSNLEVPGTIGMVFEPNQTTQVEASDSQLRNLSPFMIKVEPPLVYGENGGFQNKKKNSVSTDFSVSSGSGTSLNGYETARKAISQSGISGLRSGRSRTSSIHEIVYKSGNGKSSNLTPSGVMSDSVGNIGQPAIADVYTAVDIARQLSAIVNTPPLVMLINPTSFAIAYNKIQQYQERSRMGFIYQVWGEEQPKISMTARCGAFISGQSGLQFASRRDSKAWQNLMNVFHLFRNSGYIHDTIGKSFAHLMVGSLSIRYDGWVYYGHMESFSFAHDEEHIHGGVDFTIEFVVSAMVDTSQQIFSVSPLKSPVPSLSDPRYQGMINKSKNSAGEFSVGIDSKGNPILLTQGRDVGVGDAFLSTVPQNGVNPFGFKYKSAGSFRTPDSTTIGKTPPPAPPSETGFNLDTSVGVGNRSVAVSSPNLVDTFRVRSST